MELLKTEQRQIFESYGIAAVYFLDQERRTEFKLIAILIWQSFCSWINYTKKKRRQLEMDTSLLNIKLIRERLSHNM